MSSVSLLLTKKIQQICSSKWFPILRWKEEKIEKGVCWFAGLRLVTETLENSRQHDLSSPITAASPSFTPGSRRFVRDERRMQHLTGCASDWLWLASAAFWEAFNQSTNGNVTLALPKPSARWRLFLHLLAKCRFESRSLDEAEQRGYFWMMSNVVIRVGEAWAEGWEVGRRGLISCFTCSLKNKIQVHHSILPTSIFTCSQYSLFSITISQHCRVVHSGAVIWSQSHRKSKERLLACCYALAVATCCSRSCSTFDELLCNVQTPAHHYWLSCLHYV